MNETDWGTKAIGAIWDSIEPGSLTRIRVKCVANADLRSEQFGKQRAQRAEVKPVLYFILKLFWLCALKNSWRTFVRLYSFKVLGRYFQSDKIFITFSLGWKLHWKLFILFQGEFYEKI